MEEEHSERFVHLLLQPTEETLQSLFNKLRSKDGQWLEDFLHARGLEVSKWKLVVFTFFFIGFA